MNSKKGEKKDEVEIRKNSFTFSFLFLLPLSVFARSSPKEETIAQKNDTVVEEKAPVEKELAKETEASNPVNIRKIEGGGYYRRACR
ncbi:hypothetical protein HMPREF9130_0729 [Peptoniphilus sp. oral taxon 375 str. F0436]|nr:hypothetical protein HMPREF9130_0729 [Peptoniphilus sp. oral taxon 375 str. F0436]